MANRGEMSPETVKTWEEHTPKGKKLPERVGMKKKAFFEGFDKRADQVAGAQGEPGEPLPAEGAAPGGAAGPPPNQPEKLLKWNPAGGVDPRSPEEMAAAQAVDLITLPEGVDAASCMNCQFFRMLDPALGTGFCTNPNVKLDVTTKMHCSQWNAPDTYRAWEALDPSAVPDAGIMGEAGSLQDGTMPMEPGAVGPDGQPLAPEGGAPPEGEPKPKAKPKAKPKEKSEGGGGTNVHVHVGGAGEKKEEKGSEKKAYAFWNGFDT
jgi:hypothetical protein